VRGTVSYHKGGVVQGGVVRFQSLTDSGVTVTGIISNDGTFSLDTICENKRVSGAPLGTYRVTVAPGKDNSQLTRPITLSKTCVVAAQENEFHLRIEPPSRR
jgi:hypothetical protein